MLLFLAPLGLPESATEIVRKADERLRGNTSEASLTIQIVRPTWSREIKVRSWSKGSDLAMILITAPVKDKGTVFLKRKKEVWNWLPSIERNIKLPPSMMSQSWMGTDFTNDDLVKEASIVSDYTHTLLGKEEIGGKLCHKIELIPKPEAAIIWGKIVTWIDADNYNFLVSEYYDEDGVLINVMKGSDVRVLGGRAITSRVEMTPVDKQGNKTVLIYESIKFDKPIADEFFSVQQMQKLR